MVLPVSHCSRLDIAGKKVSTFMFVISIIIICILICGR